ncbi:MAG: hypothetical protein KOO62_08200 [candidate division Zixibacteria bacterium]|nr:hypothetical protein [candidate division Zixibacteria bacterium]
MPNKYRSSWLIWLSLLTAITFLMVILPRCTNRSVNTTNAPSVDLSFKLASSELSQMINRLHIIVTGDNMDSIDVMIPVYEDQGLVFGDTLEIPVGENRHFIVEALDAEGNVLYRGEQFTAVTPDITITVQVMLEPEVSLLKLQPRYVEIDEGKAFSVDARIFNVLDLYDLTFRVYYDSTVLKSVSVEPDTHFNASHLDFSYSLVEADPSYAEINISYIDGSVLLVDSSGSATLAGLSFVARDIVGVVDSTYLRIDTVNMYALDGGVPVIEEPFIFDSCLARITEDTTWVADTLPAVVALLTPSDMTTETDLSVLLTWQASERADLYDLAVSTNVSFSPTWIIATNLTTTSYQLTNLTHATTYYWQVQAHNDYGPADWSDNWRFTTTGDVMSPTAIEDLLIADSTTGTVLLTWTAPGDDGDIGTVDQYDIRYSHEYSILVDWTSALQVAGEPTPHVAGTSESLWVYDLPDGWNYFAVRSSDTVGNMSPISNIDSVYFFPQIGIAEFDIDYDSMGIGWKADWDDTQIAFRWSNLDGATGYYIYARDNGLNTDFVQVADVVHADYLQFQQAWVTLPTQFDSDLSDAIQTPFCNSTAIEFSIRAYNNFGMGPFFTPYVSLSDSTPPVFEMVHTYGDADNIPGTEFIDDSISLDRTLEYCQTTSNPVFSFIEAGGDENYVLPASSVNWTWNSDYRNDNGAFIRVPAGVCGAGDLLVVTIRDNSGNAAYDTLRLLPYIDVITPNESTSGFEGPLGTVIWTYAHPANTNYGSTLNYYLSLDNGATFVDTAYEFASVTAGSQAASLYDTLFSTQARIGLQNISGGCIWLSEPFTLGGIELTGPDTMVWAYEIAYDLDGTDSTAIPITWESEGIDEVKIWWREHTASSAISYTSVPVPNTGSYDFYPRDLGFNYSVKVGVMDADADGRPMDTLGWQISVVHESLTPVFPGVENELIGGADTTISWTVGGSNSGSVLLQYSQDGGSNWHDIAIVPNTGSYRWAVPQNIPSGIFKLRFRDADDEQTLAEISGLTMTGVQILSPNGGEEWLVGSMQTIQFAVFDAYGAPYVDLYFSSTDWADSTLISSSNYGSSYTWTVPNIPTNNGAIRAYGTELGLLDESDAPFTIAGFKVTYPNGGETLEVGSSVDIKWETIGSIEAVDIYIEPEGWQSIAVGVPNTGSYTWAVPDYAGLETRLRVTQASNTACNDVSDSWFSIAELTVTSPNGGEIWYWGETRLIDWTVYGWEGSFDIFLSSNDGLQWVPLVSGVSSTSYSWYLNPEGAISGTFLLKVITQDGLLFDQSDATFEIRTSPGGNH